MADLQALRLAVAQAMVAAADGGEPVVARVCRLCAQALPVDGAAFTAMNSDPVRQLLYASDAVATEITELQFSLGEGPCLQAFTMGRPVCVPDLATLDAARWPAFGPAATDLSIGGLFAFPVAIGAITIGVFDLYRHEPGYLSSDDLATILQIADLTGSALLALRATLPAPDSDRHPDADGQPDGDGDRDGDGTWLDAAGANRWRVHQATGMLIAQLGVSAEDGFARLRGYAFTHDQHIGAIAEEIVAHRLDLTLEAD
jgi:GAF domain-containing protein